MARLSSMVAVLKPFSSRYALSALRSELVSSPVSVRILQKSSSSRKIRFSMEGDSQVCICYKDLDQFRPVSLCGAYHRPSSERKPRPKSSGQRSIFEIADNRRTEPRAGVAHFDRQSSTNRSPIDRSPYAEARKPHGRTLEIGPELRRGLMCSKPTDERWSRCWLAVMGDYALRTCFRWS